MQSPADNSKRSQRATHSRGKLALRSFVSGDFGASNCTTDLLNRRLGRWLDRSGLATTIDRFLQRNQPGASRPQSFEPRLTSLEPRIVLNATAELSAASGLLIFGDLSDDVVQINAVGGGDFIQLTDGNGSVISITGHSGGATGNETDPLAIADITGGQIQVDLGGGSDTLRVDLVDGVNLDVVDGAGDDLTEIDVQPNSSPSPATSITVESETIDLAASGSLIQFANRDVNFVGDVRFGTGVPTAVTQIEIGDGSLEIDGTVTYDGSLRFIVDSGDVRLRDAVVSASSAQAQLFFEMDPNAGSVLELGQIDDSAGHLIEDLRIDSATEATFYGDIEIEGALSVDVMDQVGFQGLVSAGSIDIASDNVSSLATIESDAGSIVIVAGNQLTVGGDIDSSSAGVNGIVTLGASDGWLNGSTILTAGGNVRINGAFNVVGDVQLDTAAASSASGGDVTWIGPVTSDGALAAGRLTIDTVGSTDAGDVSFTGDIGGTLVTSSDHLESLAIAAGVVSVRSASVDGGSIAIDADQIRIFGASIRSTDQLGMGGGNLQLNGDTVFQLMNTDLVSAGDLILDGINGTLGPDDDLTIASGGTVLIRGELRGGNALSIDSQSSLRIEADVVDWSTIQLSADGGVEIASAQIAADDSVFVLDAVDFQSDTRVVAGTVRIDQTVSVAAGQVAIFDSVMIDSIGQTEIGKLGDGELVLAEDNTFVMDVVVQAGTLRIEGSVSAGANIAVQSGAVLAGSGDIAGVVSVSGGTIAPNESAPAVQTGQLRVSSLLLSPDATFSVNVDGNQVGQSLDSIAVTNQPVDLAGAILELDLSVTLPGDTELLIVQNDSAGQITGRFFANFDENGVPLTTARELVEGALVLNQFGPGAAAVPAYITYFGGDGNDVTIVTAGDHVQPAGNVTIVTRSGVDLQIRTGDSFPDAQNAMPTIRPIAGLNGRTLSIEAAAAGAELYVDIDGFVDVGTNPLHFDADIVFDTASVGGDAQVTLYDSVLTSIDSPDRFDVQYQTARQAVWSFNHADGVAPDYSVLTGGGRYVDLQLPSLVLSTELSDLDDQWVVTADPDSDFAFATITTNNLVSEFRFRQPADSFVIEGRDGDDVLAFDGFGGNLVAVPTVLGGDGDDHVLWNADVAVGQVGVVRDFQIDAEAVSVGGDIQLIGGGAVRINATDQLDVASTIDATSGKIVVDSAANLSDLSTGQLTSSATGIGISLHGGDYLIGDFHASDGTVQLGAINGLGSVGSIWQSLGTQIDASRVVAESTGLLDLGSALNRIGEIDLVAADAVMVLDSSDDLIAAVSTDSSIDIQVAGDLIVDLIVSSGSASRLIAAGNLVGQAGQTLVHVAGDSVELLAGVRFPGQSNMPGSLAEIGTAVIPMRVAAGQVFSATTSGTNGAIYIESPAISGFPFASGALPIGLIDAGNGRIEVSAVSIDDAFAVDDIDLIGAAVDLNADSGIGRHQTLSITGVADIEAVSVMGAIQFDVVADRNVNLSRVVTGGGPGESILIHHFGDDRLSITNVENADGDVTIVTETASIDVLQRIAGGSLAAATDGHIILENLGGQADISVRGSVASTFGDVTIAAQRNLVFTPTGRLDSVDGSIRLSGGNDGMLSASTIALMDGSVIDAGTGTVALTSPGNVFVSSIVSQNTGTAIIIESETGGLIDSGDLNTDLIAGSGIVQIDVAGGIGDGDPLETEIGDLVAHVRAAGGIQIANATAIQLIDVETFDGMIDVIAQGTITVHQLTSVNDSGQDGLMHRDIQLNAIGQTSDIWLRSLVGQGVTDVILLAGDDVLGLGVDTLLIADDLAITSLNGSDDSTTSVRLRTDVNDLELAVFGINRGDAEINEVNSIRLAASDRQDDSEIIVTANGELRINAGATIMVADTSLIDDQDSLRGDVEIIAGGENGRIRLSAADSIQLGDRVQLKAAQFGAGSVALDSIEIVLGGDFQIETGDAIGVARVFATRPDEGLIDTAFYDSTTVQTNRLEQAAVNDATGILSVAIGNDGERGLTINIDWGAETNRFQQIDLLSGDAPPLQVDHLYLEGDILDARFNGRTSSTDPLEVRFSVRHHESILVTGQTIQQSASEVQLVEGELISSTDNPLTMDNAMTPILENGTAQFIIPALSIPVAFFPVRDVIPTIENEPVFVSNDQSFTVLGSGMETTETVASSTTAREEYFQIRVLSPDPEGADLVPPTRLPDDIISGDRLKMLFESLPDGRYDIQYVLGDGNVRSILSVDLRDGKPILPGGQLDGGTMRLIPVDPESPESAETSDSLDRRLQQDEQPVENELPTANEPKPDQASIDSNVEQIGTLRIGAPSRSAERLDHALTGPNGPALTIESGGRLSVAGRFRVRASHAAQSGFSHGAGN